MVLVSNPERFALGLELMIPMSPAVLTNGVTMASLVDVIFRVWMYCDIGCSKLIIFMSPSCCVATTA